LDSARLKLKALEDSYETDLEDAQLSLEVAIEKRDLLLNPKERDLNQAKSSITSAEAALLSAKAKLKDLIDGASTTDISIQQQNVKLAELALVEALDKLEDYKLISPIDGIVGQINIDVGDKINSSTSVMMISDPNSIRIDLTVSETDLIGLNEGMYGIALFDSLPDQFYVISISNVSQIPKVTQGIVTYPVESEILTGQSLMQALPELMRLASGLSMTGDLGNFSSMMPGGGMGGPPGESGGRGMPDIDIECAQKAIGTDLDFSDFRSLGRENIEKLRDSGCVSSPSAPPGGGMQAMMETLLNPSLPPAGMTANVILLKGIKDNLLLVPSKAISRRGRDAFVNKKISEIDIEEIKVTLGESDGTRTQILSGVEEGDTIILIVNTSTGNQQESRVDSSDPPPPPGGGMRGRGGFGPR
jgi:multidrug efflux pump subunit AcrA (membrane-fusion protein)